jgi:putative membrane protein
MSYLEDPRVLFAAERTLLAWNRTSLAMMAFGFAIERFGLFLQYLAPNKTSPAGNGTSFWVGMAFLLMGAYIAAAASMQFRRVIKTLGPKEIPEHYNVHLPVTTNIAVTVLGLVIAAYLFLTR